MEEKDAEAVIRIMLSKYQVCRFFAKDMLCHFCTQYPMYSKLAKRIHREITGNAIELINRSESDDIVAYSRKDKIRAHIRVRGGRNKTSARNMCITLAKRIKEDDYFYGIAAFVRAGYKSGYVRVRGLDKEVILSDERLSKGIAIEEAPILTARKVKKLENHPT